MQNSELPLAEKIALAVQGLPTSIEALDPKSVTNETITYPQPDLWLAIITTVYQHVQTLENPSLPELHELFAQLSPLTLARLRRGIQYRLFGKVEEYQPQQENDLIEKLQLIEIDDLLMIILQASHNVFNSLDRETQYSLGSKYVEVKVPPISLKQKIEEALEVLPEDKRGETSSSIFMADPIYYFSLLHTLTSYAETTDDANLVAEFKQLSGIYIHDIRFALSVATNSKYADDPEFRELYRYLSGESAQTSLQHLKELLGQ